MRACAPDAPHDRVAPSLALCRGCGRPVVVLRQHGGALDDTTLVGLGVAVVALAAGLGLAGKLHEALRDPSGRQQLDDRGDP